MKRLQNQEGTPDLTSPASVSRRPGAVDIAPTQKQIENTIDALRRLAEAIEDFKKKRASAKAELIRSLAKDLAAGPLNVERAIVKHKAWQATDELLASKIETAEELRPIIEELIEELKRAQPDALKTALRRKLKQLEEEASAEQKEAALLKQQIDSLKALLQELEKPRGPTAKRKKE